MPLFTITANPTSVYDLTTWTVTGGTATAVVTDTDDATYIEPTVATDKALYEFSNITGAPDSSAVTSCIINYRCYFPDAGANVTADARINNNPVTGSTFTPIGAPPVTEDKTYDFSTANTVSLFNAARFGCEANWSAGAPRLAKLSGTITYDLPPGGLIFLICSWLGPLVAVGLHELPAIVSEFTRRSGQILLPAEVARLWSELRSCRHPSWNRP